ncbi:MAG TPA: hypothetical protein VJN18_03950 [Polyangiaceae bacterium]|nr:hypothetical protein [Polyangiaceae bacterium]
MSHPDSGSDDDLEQPVLTRDALTPRGGFMARPGLKAPPRHAVVIRGGDVEPSEDIPLVRASQPPPTPAREAPPVSSNEQVTLPAILTPKSEVATLLDLSPPALVAPPLESLPPPSEMPVVASVGASDLEHARVRRRARSRWTIVAVAAAGLLLGSASIAATCAQRNTEPKSAAAPPGPAEVLAPPRRTTLAQQPPGLQSAFGHAPSLAPSASSGAPLPTAPAARQVPAASGRARQVGSKRSIF